MYVRTTVWSLTLSLVALWASACSHEAAQPQAPTAAAYRDAVLAMELPALERQLRASAPAPASWALNR